MKVLTVRQPWAGSIIHHGKTPENRTRNVAGTYRGPLAIHVSQRHDYEAQNGPHHNILGFIDQHHTYGWGCVIGVVDLVDVHTAEDELLVDGLGTPACCESKWAEFEYVDVQRLCDAEPTRVSTVVHLVLENPRPIVPIACRGQLGLWNTPDHVTAWIEDQLRSAS